MLKFSPILLTVILFGCKDEAVPQGGDTLPPKTRDSQAISEEPETEGSSANSEFWFDDLHARIVRLKDFDDHYFSSQWPTLRQELLSSIDHGRFKNVSQTHQRNLWETLEFLRSCHDPQILEQHGDEIVGILYRLNAPEENALLREILEGTGARTDQSDTKAADKVPAQIQPANPSSKDEKPIDLRCAQERPR